MADIAFDDQVDITDKVCPLTFVKAKVAIEGHKILKLEDNEDGTYTLYVRKVED